jgi:hypothetical protein
MALALALPIAAILLRPVDVGEFQPQELVNAKQASPHFLQGVVRDVTASPELTDLDAQETVLAHQEHLTTLCQSGEEERPARHLAPLASEAPRKGTQNTFWGGCTCTAHLSTNCGDTHALASLGVKHAMRMCGEQHSDCFNRFVICVTYVELLSLRLKPNIVLGASMNKRQPPSLLNQIVECNRYSHR